MATPFITGVLGLGGLNNGVLTEPAAPEYQRQFITFTAFPGGTSSNDEAASFGIPASNWGTLSSWGVFDGLGNLVFSGPLSTPINAMLGTNGNPTAAVTVFAGAITVTFVSATNPT